MERLSPTANIGLPSNLLWGVRLHSLAERDCSGVKELFWRLRSSVLLIRTCWKLLAWTLAVLTPANNLSPISLSLKALFCWPSRSWGSGLCCTKSKDAGSLLTWLSCPLLMIRACTKIFCCLAVVLLMLLFDSPFGKSIPLLLSRLLDIGERRGQTHSANVPSLRSWSSPSLNVFCICPSLFWGSQLCCSKSTDPKPLLWWFSWLWPLIRTCFEAFSCLIVTILIAPSLWASSALKLLPNRASNTLGSELCWTTFRKIPALLWWLKWLSWSIRTWNEAFSRWAVANSVVLSPLPSRTESSAAWISTIWGKGLSLANFEGSLLLLLWPPSTILSFTESSFAWFSLVACIFLFPRRECSFFILSKNSSGWFDSDCGEFKRLSGGPTAGNLSFTSPSFCSRRDSWSIWKFPLSTSSPVLKK